MPNYKVSRKAVSDLIEIGRYTEEIWGITQRNLYLKKIDYCFDQLSNNPNLGVECDHIRQGYRKFPQGSHIVFYRLDHTNIVEFIRVLHKSMDVESYL